MLSFVIRGCSLQHIVAGKVVLSAFLLRNFSHVMGVEYVPSRFERSCLMMEVLEELAETHHKLGQTSAPTEAKSPAGETLPERTANTIKSRAAAQLFQVQPGRKISIFWGDASKAPLTSAIASADIVFTCNTCFGEQLMAALMNSFAQLREGARLIVLHALPDHPVTAEFEEVAHLQAPMSWAKAVDVFVYRKVSPAHVVQSESDSPKSLEMIPTCRVSVDDVDVRLHFSHTFDPDTYIASDAPSSSSNLQDQSIRPAPLHTEL